MRAGNVVLSARPASAAALAGAGSPAALIAAVGAPMATVMAAARLGRITCITAALDQVEAGHCTMWVQSEPRVEIVINQAAARSCDLGFAAACLFLLLRPAPALAQSIDYGAAEALFGEPVTASATDKLQRVSDVPANMELITAEQIRRSGADNLPDILRFVPGLDVRRYGFAAADVGVRGYARPLNPRLLVLVNGQQVYLNDYGRTQWYARPCELDEIRQVIVSSRRSAPVRFRTGAGCASPLAAFRRTTSTHAACRRRTKPCADPSSAARSPSMAGRAWPQALRSC